MRALFGFLVIVGFMVLVGLAFFGCNGEGPPQPSPSPTVEPTSTPTPVPTPTPPTGWTCFVPPDGPQWHPVEPTPASTMIAPVRRAQVELGDVCGRNPEDSLDALAAHLIEGGVCAKRQGDAVMVGRTDSIYTDDTGVHYRRFEEMHAIYYGNGCWIATPFRGVWSVE